MSITGSPRNSDFFEGLDVSLTCIIDLNSAIDSPIAILTSWQRNESDVDIAVGKHISVTNASINAPLSTYQTTLRFNPLDLEDIGTYTCEVTVLAEDRTFITGTTAFSIRNITGISSESIL